MKIYIIYAKIKNKSYRYQIVYGGRVRVSIPENLDVDETGAHSSLNQIRKSSRVCLPGTPQKGRKEKMIILCLT